MKNSDSMDLDKQFNISDVFEVSVQNLPFVIHRIRVDPSNRYSLEPTFPILNSNLLFTYHKVSNLSEQHFEQIQYFSYHLLESDETEKCPRWELNHKIENNESFYGLGDKAVSLNLRGRKCILWGTDTYAFGYGNEPLYKNIPFFIQTYENQCIGFFIINTFKLTFDFGHTNPDQLKITGDGGPIDIFILNGDSPVDIISLYTKITGCPELPPLWALGYHQSKWSYSPESKLRQVANKLRELKIPCDCLYLDIDYMRGYRIFTWDKRRFPDPANMIHDMNQQGFKIVAILDPGVKIDKNYFLYNEGLKKNLFLKNPDNTPATGPVWPGYCHFPDFTSKEARLWWEEHIVNLLKTGLSGLWNDMNEIALFNKNDMIQTQRTLNNDILMSFEGNTATFAEGHNIYGMMMSHATYAGLKHISNKRPFVLTRSTFSGGQEYAAVWTGDNVASWEHLKIANYQCQNIAISGFSFTGSDIGGFVGNPDGELFCRWLQLAVFHPFFRTHSSKDFDAQEPWSFGEKWTDIARSIIEWRYKILGYIYSVFKEHTETGKPILQPIILKYWKDQRYRRHYDNFMLGEALLAIPITEPGLNSVDIFLPPGVYYCLNTYKVYYGETNCQIPIYWDTPPALLRGGYVLLIWPIQQYVLEKKIENVEWWLGYSNEAFVQSYYYMDEFDGYNYSQGDFQKVMFSFENRGHEIHIYIHSEGNYCPEIKSYKLKLLGFDLKITSIKVDNMNVIYKNESSYITFNSTPKHILICLKS